MAAPEERIEPAADDLAALDRVRQSTLDLLSGLPHPPTSLRVAAAGVTIEAEWNAVPGAAPAVPAPVAAPAAAEPAADPRHLLCAPSVGVFYAAPEPGADPFVAVGDAVTAGQQVAIVEVMKLMIPVVADRDGRIAEVLCTDGTPVEFDEPLFALAC